MAQTIGNPAAGIGGMQLGMGASGPLVHLWATGDPNTRTGYQLDIGQRRLTVLPV